MKIELKIFVWIKIIVGHKEYLVTSISLLTKKTIIYFLSRTFILRIFILVPPDLIPPNRHRQRSQNVFVFNNSLAHSRVEFKTVFFSPAAIFRPRLCRISRIFHAFHSSADYFSYALG